MVRYKKTIYSSLIKPSLDLLVALALIIALSWLLFIIAALIKITTKGKVFFTQTRVGKNEKLFTIYKFKTMIDDVPFDIHNPVVKDSNKNLTRIGRFLRRTKLDELPQLFNIVKLDMSFIGPRPFVPDYMDHYEEWEKVKFLVKPGLTGWSQVHGNGYLELKHRSYYDIDYVLKISLWTDLKIIVKSIFVVLFGEQRFLKPVERYQLNHYKYWENPELRSELETALALHD